MAWWSVVAGVVVGVVIAFSRFHQPGYGFTYLIDFGEDFGLARLPDLEAVPFYIHRGVPGYDGQYYAQIALRPAADDPALVHVIDNPTYRGGRIFMSWTAWLLGGGNTSRVLDAYAMINLATWLGLAVLLLRWFRPASMHSILCWAGVMLSAGMLASLRHALTDGPATFLLAVGVALIESRRRWPAAGALAIAALTRETSLLGAIGFAPDEWRPWKAWRAWMLAGVKAVLVVVPLALWVMHLRHAWHISGDGGSFGGIALPLTGYIGRWKGIAHDYETFGWTQPFVGNLALHFGITVQALWILARPRWTSVWWRIGALHVLLLAFCSPAVWEGYSGASSRALLPLLFAFNVLAPRNALGLALVLAGNLTVVAGLAEMRAPLKSTWRTDGPAALVSETANGQRVEVDYVSGFFGPEADGKLAWRWTSGNAVFRITNPHSFPLAARVHLGMRGTRARHVTLTAADAIVWSGPIGAKIREMDLTPFVIPPGGIEIKLDAGGAGAAVGLDQRTLAVAVFNIVVGLSPAP